MRPLLLVMLGSGVVAGTALITLALYRAPRIATLVAVLGAGAGGVAGLVGALIALGGGGVGELAATWQVPGGGIVVGIDPLSAFFLAPLFVLGPLCAVYGRSYLGPRPVAAAMLNLLLAAMALVLVARHALLFLVAWEVMTLLAYLLITLELGTAEVRRAGWSYLIASHVAMVALFALFLLLGTRSEGALDFQAFGAAWRAPGADTIGILLLALVGFGIKAGVVGLHVWLPEAHAAAPSHVSALMSGVLIKLGIYGLLRVTLLVAPAAWFGVTLAILGASGALFAIALALYQRDVKRVLAYSSVENVGIILLGLGLGIWARERGDAPLAALAFAGGLLHIWNHTAMKGLLFLAAGSVVHGSGTKDMEALGGLLGRMRWTGRAMAVGAIAIAALPPLNGFASEWLIYRALAAVGVHGASTSGLVAIGGAVALALAGGLAALCFVRLIGVTLLGTARSEAAARAHESPSAMTVPLGVLAAACLVGAPAGALLVSVQAPLLAELGAGGLRAAAEALAPVATVSTALLAAIVLVAALVASRRRRAEAADTWGCGYAAPTARMQYTGSAFSELLSARVLPRWARARQRTRLPEGLFPRSATFTSDTADPVMRGVYEPLLSRLGDSFARLRFLQQGNVHIYILYIVATAILALGWVAARDWLAF